ncbi:hypothetical protein CW745_11765 [Psychromonas sp. psych-6C06]|uniref:hypothetical protein n=1 Tax=Psychromonas sp. psych-6C06 TaxID=2058089 RepID=UPI000C33A41F|nr:hypothetical protein [Psychromonas sp. psych-6C06]PKF61303.1 hypothetical protein CW745_11765 [Psychromonas sp. psych-6C06]
MIFSRGQVLLCNNGTWRKVTGVNRLKGEVYYTSNSGNGKKIHAMPNMSMQFWCTYHDVREVDSIHTAELCTRFPELQKTAQSKGLHFAEKHITLALS